MSQLVVDPTTIRRLVLLMWTIARNTFSTGATTGPIIFIIMSTAITNTIATTNWRTGPSAVDFVVNDGDDTMRVDVTRVSALGWDKSIIKAIRGSVNLLKISTLTAKQLHHHIPPNSSEMMGVK